MQDVLITIAVVIGAANIVAGTLVTVRAWRWIAPPVRIRTGDLVAMCGAETHDAGHAGRTARTRAMTDQPGPDRHPAQKILVIEDDGDLQEMLVDALSALGYDVYSARNGVDGLAMIRAGRDTFSIVLLDLGLAEMNGFEFLAAQSHDPSIDAIPVIVMSGRSAIDENQRPKAWVHTLHKPMMVTEVVDAVAQFAR